MLILRYHILIVLFNSGQYFQIPFFEISRSLDPHLVRPPNFSYNAGDAANMTVFGTNVSNKYTVFGTQMCAFVSSLEIVIGVRKERIMYYITRSNQY